MRLLLFGSGAFGLPTFEALHAGHDIVAVVSQPDRPAGRRRRPTATPVSMFALDAGLPLHRPDDVNAPEVIESLHRLGADAWVVIAYGQKLSQTLLGEHFAVNLHGSILPSWRGAAPVQRAVLAGDPVTGVSVIALASRMDAGDIFETRTLEIGSTSTAGEIHDALALLGPGVVEEVLEAYRSGTIRGRAQDENDATHAPKMARRDGVLRADMDGDEIRRRINGCAPWPGCPVRIAGVSLRLLRAGPGSAAHAAGEIDSTGCLATLGDAVQVLEVHPAGGRPMPFETWANGRRCDWPVPVEFDA